MYLPFKRISRGEGPESFTLQLPFSLAEVGEFPEADALAVGEAVEVVLGERPGLIIRREHYYIIRVEGFGAEAEARDFLEKIGAAMFLISLRRRMGIHFRHEPDPIEREHNSAYRDAYPPELYGGWERRADGTYTDGGTWPKMTVIIPEHERIVEHSMGFARRVARITAADIAEAFAYAEQNHAAGELFKNDRLVVAFDVYSSAYSQHNRVVAFLHLVTVLEILSERKRAAPVVRGAVDHLMGAVEAMRAELPDREGESAADDAALAALSAKLPDLKRQSIAEAISEMVYEAVHSAESLPREESKRMVKEIYRVRSELVHGGYVKGSETRPWHERFGVIAELERIVRALLAREYNKALKPEGTPVDLS